ncbi:molybdopterin-dependent oxidoreductase [Rhizobium binxianense]|uniref:molybdopterin-dependent oxidoreductase n=1 Tax=Rhizobium binxianense TaxID=3024242 RepID=UPI00235E6200|nr:molybdopterin-dependent oxidoreductase [Rhizobium sp. MJ37]MDC9835953.1 molybdopterin-dependent oxidoreductase [Rhizobium sp. MJ37]
MTRQGLRMTMEGFSYRGPNRGVHALEKWRTDEEDLFLVTHMGFLEIDPEQWYLEIGGLVDRPITLRLADIQAMPQREYMSFHECAGSPLAPQEPKRRVGNVVWKGVPLKEVLVLAGIAKEATYVWTSGLEWGEYAGLQNEIFQKDLPIHKAMADEVLLALEINGKPLSPDRGGPVRLVVPGWYGTNSVKWIGSIIAADCRAPGPYTTRFYNDTTPTGTKPVWAVAPESVIVGPDPAVSLQSGTATRIWGWAWGDEPIASAEVSVDGGSRWHAASVGPRQDRSWQQFEYFWTPTRGQHVLKCRCTNVQGETQPLTPARNAVHDIAVTVVDA